ncbi:MAG TPA: MFS transporter [Caulobacteraceae bacterium]|nr:MFS transporter [Caulobacteraceae bacterium]
MKAASAKIAEWRRSWPVVIAGSLATAFSVVHLYTLGVFFAPLEAEFGWSRSEISLGLTIISVVSVLFAPFVGLLVDRLGPRRIGVPGVLVYAAGIASLALVAGSVWTWWAAWLLVACGSVMMKPTVWTAAAASWFRESRGFAFAMILSGGGLCLTLAPSLANYFLDAYGWRGAYLLLSAVGLAVALPVVFFFFFSAEDRQRINTGTRTFPQDQLPGLGIRESLLSTRFIRLAVVAGLMTACVSALIVHFLPMVVAGGLERATAVKVAGFIGVFAIVGRLFGGFLLDLIEARLVGAVSISAAAVACVLLLGYDGSVLTASIIACLIGYSLGSETELVSYMVPRYFGRRNFGVIYGTIAGLFSFGTGLGPLMASFVYDITKAYDLAVMILIPAFLLNVLLVATMGRPPKFEAPPVDADGAETPKVG